MKHVRLLFLLLPILLNVELTEAQPCYSGYQYRLPIIINNQSAPQLFNHQVHIQLNTQNLIAANKLKSNGADIRILDRFGSPLNYYLDSSSINTTATSIWVKTDSIKGYNSDTLYLFYGNASASSGSTASSTFLLFDDFNGSSISGLWSSCGASPTVAGGKVTLKGNTKSALYSNAAFANPVIAEVWVDSIIGKGSLMGLLNSSLNGYGIYNDSASYYIGSIGSSGSCFAASTVNAGNTLNQTKGKWTFIWSATANQSATNTSGAFSATNALYSPSSPLKALLAQTDTGGSLIIDRIALRSYSSANLSLSFGTEITVNYSISPSYNNPICEGQDLRLSVDSITGATYTWSGPNSFSATVRNPVIPSASSVQQGLYTINVDIPTGCASKSSSVNVSIIAKAKGGTLAGSASVCAGSNGGTMTLNTFLGNIMRWDSAQNINGPWYPITKTTQNHTFNNLIQTIYYRVIVGNGNCSLDSSSVATIAVTPASVGGSVSGSDSVCENTNSGVLTLTGYTGSITKWESSENGFLWNPISNSSTTQSYSGLIKTTYYRAVVKNGICNEEKSDNGTITVSKTTVAGTAGPNQVVCLSSNQGFVKLSGFTGSILAWESSTNNGSSWTAINKTTDSIEFVNITQNTLFRAYVKNGKCGGSYSNPAAVSLSSSSVAGTISGSAEVCEGSSSGVLTLSGYQGSILKWQSKGIKDNVWSDISNVTTTYNWSSLADTTSYRVLVGNSTCASDTSALATIRVNPTSQSGYINGTDRVCETNGNGKLSLSSFIGKIQDWEMSTNGYSNWNALSNQTDSVILNNLTQTQYYRAIVKSGQCAKVYTAVKSVGYDKITVAGNIGNTQEVCESNNYGLFTINGARGDVQKWQYAKNGVWTDINRTQNTYTYSNLTDSTWFRSIVKNGVCAVDTTNSAKVIIYPTTSVGSISGTNTLCIDNASTVLKLTNYTGQINSWEMSANGASSWSSISNTTDSLVLTNVNSTNYYRAVVQSGVCAKQYTNAFKLQIDTLSKGGYFSANQEVCENNNFGALTLLGSAGSILKWQKNVGSGWADITNTSSSYNWSNLSGTNYFRAIAKNGVCKSDTSNDVSVIVYTASATGSISGKDKVCINEASGVLKLVGYNGTIVGWEKSNNATSGFTSLSNTTDSVVYTNLTQTTYYKVEVKNGACASSKINAYELRVDGLSKGGSFASNQQVCENNNFGSLNLLNSNGAIVKWQKNTGSSWADISNVTTTYNWTNLSGNTEFRAIATNGVCGADTSSVVSVKVDTYSATGSISGNDKVCINEASGVLKLVGYNGTILGWEKSNNATSGFTSLSNSTDSVVYTNLTQTTYYKVEVKNGVCASSKINGYELRVDGLSKGGSFAANQEVCENNNFGALTLLNATGAITKWQKNTGSVWTDISNTNTLYNWNNLSGINTFRAIAKNGVCAADTSSTVSVQVFTYSNAGAITGADKLCINNANGTLKLVGYNGKIADWKISTNNTTWTDLNLYNDSLDFTSLAQTTYYKAEVKNGVCATSTSAVFGVRIDALSNGGTLSDDQEVCTDLNNGTLKLTNATGIILRWEKLVDTTFTWAVINKVATDRYDFLNLKNSSQYKVAVQNGVCPEAYSNTVNVKVWSKTIAGNLSGATTFCSLINNGVIQLNSNNGRVVKWQTSVDNGINWNDNASTDSTLIYSNLQTSVLFKAQVQNGVCSIENTATAKVEVFKPSTNGIIESADTVFCENAPFGTIRLKNATFSTNSWQKSEDNGATWNDVASDQTNLYFNQVNKTSLFRSIAKNETCKADTSANIQIRIVSASLPGSLTNFAPVCASSGKVVIKNGGYKGAITNWSLADNINGPWSNLGWFADSLVISNPINSKFYRTTVKNELCPEVMTTPTQLIVHSKSAAGVLVGNTTVCIGNNQGELTLNGLNGDNIKWRKSTGAAFLPEPGNSATLEYKGLTSTTSYKAIVSNGVCADDTSNTITINMFPQATVDFNYNQTCTDAMSHFADLSSGVAIKERLWQMSDGYKNTDSSFNRAFAIPGTYDVVLTITSTDGCATTSNKPVTIFESPIAHFNYQNQNGDQWGCDNDSVWMFNLSMSSASSNSYYWQFSDGTNSILENPTKQFTTPGVYTIELKITTGQGCVDSTSKNISIVGHNKVAIVAPTKVSMGMPFGMTAPEGYVNYLWSPASQFKTADTRNPQVTITTSGNIYLTVTDRYGCSSTDSAYINTENDFKIRPNNIITPEGNGQNDVWVVNNLENYPNNTVRLYDRWGRMVYEANNYKNTWNGEDQSGKALADGTYYYVISFKDSKAVYKGAITLIRNN